MHRISLLCFLFAGFSFLIFSCNSGPSSVDELVQGTVDVKVNPYGKVPLGALLSFTTKEACKAEIEVLGETPFQQAFSNLTKYHELPLIGLYPGKKNTVRLTLSTESGQSFSKELEIETAPLPETFPEIEVTQLDRANMEPGFHLFDMLIANNGKFLSYTILFDDQGVIRWFMDMSSNGQITYSAHQLKNKNWLYLNWIDLQELSVLGKEVRRDQMWGHAGNHELIELADGTLLVGGSKKDAAIIRNGQVVPSRFDHVVIWDRKGKGQAVKDWDLAEYLDVDRMVYPPDYSLDFASDWFHLNSIDLDPKDNSVLVSGRNQGVLKANADKQLEWILAPHRNWGLAGRQGKGLNTADYLLVAVDAEGNPYPQAVQDGSKGMPDFEWPTGQHAARKLANGNILLFDNGLMRNFKTGPTYSRAVEYKVDPQRRTIQQVWQYGKERGLDMYSPITSEVDVLPQTGNRLVTAGNVRAGQERPHAKMVEITYPDNQVLFEAKIYFKDALGTKEKSWAQFDIVFRSARFSF